MFNHGIFIQLVHITSATIATIILEYKHRISAHSATPIRGILSARHDEKVRLSLSSERTQGSPLYETMSESWEEIGSIERVQ